eukprot:Rhum_TRINITY_DN22863_c0_g1::Rhum_TRINITY_DN22863_c0_g1_i1::g.176303::m.176303
MGVEQQESLIVGAPAKDAPKETTHIVTGMPTNDSEKVSVWRMTPQEKWQRFLSGECVNAKWSYRAWNAILAFCACNAICCVFVINGVCSLFSVNSIGSLMSINSLGSIWSINSFLSIGCAQGFMEVCL